MPCYLAMQFAIFLFTWLQDVQKFFSFSGTLYPGCLPGICLWTLLEDFRPRFPRHPDLPPPLILGFIYPCTHLCDITGYCCLTLTLEILKIMLYLYSSVYVTLLTSPAVAEKTRDTVFYINFEISLRTKATKSCTMVTLQIYKMIFM